MSDINADDVISHINHKLDDVTQQRIRNLYKQVDSGFDLERAPGVKKVLEEEWKKIQIAFAKALQQVKKDTGLN